LIEGLFKGAEAGFPMKVTVERAELLKSLGHVHRVVERRNTIPILANVLIKAERASSA
jgi:DNA polymerase sliding clamp subunit (PCNA homolog)